MGKLPAKLAEIVEDFSFCQGREKLEYLLEYAERLPDVPEPLLALKDDAHQVHECVTPIWLYAEENAGKYRFYFDVPRESPTVRGFASIMQEGARDVTLEELLAIPYDFYYEMGLQDVLSDQRLNGISAILFHMKRQATANMAA